MPLKRSDIFNGLRVRCIHQDPSHDRTGKTGKIVSYGLSFTVKWDDNFLEDGYWGLANSFEKVSDNLIVEETIACSTCGCHNSKSSTSCWFCNKGDKNG